MHFKECIFGFSPPPKKNTTTLQGLKIFRHKITQINFLDIFGQKQSLNKKKWEVVKVKLGIMKSH